MTDPVPLRARISEQVGAKDSADDGKNFSPRISGRAGRRLDHERSLFPESIDMLLIPVNRLL